MKKLFLLMALSLLAVSCNPLSKTAAAGIIKSVNGGADWQFANVYATSTTVSLTSLSISKLDFDPQNRQTLFAGSYTDGLFKSTDSADSWNKILSKFLVYDFAVNPIDTKIIYAAGFYAEHGRVLKTTDGGASWNQIFNEESLNNAVRGIAINPTNPNQIVIGTSAGSIIKSADAGISWQLAKNFEDKVNRVLWQNGNIYILLKAKGLFKSADFGLGFAEATQPLSKSTTISDLNYYSNPIGSFSQLYVDFTTPGLIYITTDKGLYKSTDEGINWTLLKLPIKPDQAAAHAIALSKNNSNTVYTSVGSTVYKSLDGGSTWQTQKVNATGFVNYLLIDPQLPQIVYGGIYSNP